jgi:hypothetical protein
MATKHTCPQTTNLAAETPTTSVTSLFDRTRF